MAVSASKLCFFFLFFYFLILCSSLQSPSTSTPPPPPKPSVYEVLRLHGLPSGLLPDSVVNYTLTDDGTFQVNLQKPCYIEFDYYVYYDTQITGVLNIGSITELNGIQVQRFYFLWFDVDEIRVDLPPSNSIYFKVGIINKELDVQQFLQVRSCEDNALKMPLPTPVHDIPMLLTE